jgi:hypothetical protein
MTDALRRLVELANAEHRLVAAGEADELAAVQDDMAQALAELPDFLDADSRARLAEAYALRERTITLLRSARDEAAAEVAKLDQGRSAVRGYAPAGMSAGTSAVDSSV